MSVAELEFESRSKYKLPFPRWVLSLTRSKCSANPGYSFIISNGCQRNAGHGDTAIIQCDRAIIPKGCVNKSYSNSDSMDLAQLSPK